MDNNISIMMTALHDLYEEYDHSSKLSGEVHLFWTLTSSSAASSQHNIMPEKVDEIQFAIAYNLPNLALHDQDIDHDDERYHHENVDEGKSKTKEDATKSINYWLAFGISPQGGMIGADFMIYLPRRHTQQHGQQDPLLLDAHGVQYSFPILDSCGQDWSLLNSYSVINDGCNQQCEGCSNTTDYDEDCSNYNNTSWHILHVKRSLSSNDANEDVPFLDDSSIMTNPTFVLAAWGELNDGSERESDGRKRMRRNNRSLVESNATLDSTKDGDVHKLDLASIMKPHGPMQRVSTSVRLFVESESDDNDMTAMSPAVVSSQSHQEQRQNPNSNLLTPKSAAFYDNMPYIDLIPKEAFRIPTDETTYKNFCFSITDFPELTRLLHEQQDKTVHIIGFQNMIQTNSPVHHMDLHGTMNPTLSSDTRLCRVYMDLIHPWEAGSPTEFAMPLEAGIPMGYEDVDSEGSSGSGGYKAFRLEVHYHNPHKSAGLLDQSGVRIYYSIEKRENVAGLMLLGDYMLRLRGSYTVGGIIPDKDGNSNANDKKGRGSGMKHSFYCPPSCFSKKRLGRSNNVTVFREVLHMHKSGERMTNIHLDSNGSIVRASEANYFDFSRGAGYGSRGNLPYQINEGDSFITTCYFASKNVTFGSSSSQEMCQTFIWYYPQEDDLSLTCGYVDTTKRGLNDTLNPIGCEVSYDRKQVSLDMERLSPNEQCQPAEKSVRPITLFDSTVNNRQEWQSLSELVERWKQSRMPVDEDINSKTSNSKPNTKSIQSPLQKDCHLCPNGQRPAQPDSVITGYSWTCDELDAAIPVLYTEPELLYISSSDVPPCEDYSSAFGSLCCSLAVEEESDTLFTSPIEYSFAFLVLAFLVTLVFVQIKRQHAKALATSTSVVEMPAAQLS